MDSKVSAMFALQRYPWMSFYWQKLNVKGEKLQRIKLRLDTKAHRNPALHQVIIDERETTEGITEIALIEDIAAQASANQVATLVM